MTLFFMSGCEKKENQPTQQQVQTKNKQTKSSDIKLTTTNETLINLTPIKDGFIFHDFKDKIVLVNFFATWCPPCKYEIPHLANLQKKYKDNLQTIGVLLEENKTNSELREFIKEFEINYPVTNGSANFNFANIFGGVQSIPTTFIFDKSGKYVTHYNGAAPEEMIDFDIQKVLNKK